MRTTLSSQQLFREMGAPLHVERLAKELGS